MNELEQARKIINDLDGQIAALFEKRMEASALVAKFKREHGLSILDEAREKEVILKNSALLENTEIKEYYIQLLKEIMSLSRAYQTRLNEGKRVAYSGVVGAYAYVAAEKMYPESTLVAYNSFEEAYRAVEKGECDVCVLPIENSYAGDVSTVMDLMFSGTLYVNQVLDLAISHSLMVNEGVRKEDIKKVISHPQALAQCAGYIKKMGYEAVSYENTALAAKLVKESNSRDTAAIASAKTAQIFGLEILENGINESRSNTTRFVALTRALNKTSLPKGADGHFMLVFTVKNEAGALAKTIDIIGAHGYNMRCLRSRPMKELLWSYYFYIEADGNINSQDGKEMLMELGATCDKLKLVGVYTSKAIEK